MADADHTEDIARMWANMGSAAEADLAHLMRRYIHEVLTGHPDWASRQAARTQLAEALAIYRTACEATPASIATGISTTPARKTARSASPRRETL